MINSLAGRTLLSLNLCPPAHPFLGLNAEAQLDMIRSVGRVFNWLLISSRAIFPLLLYIANISLCPPQLPHHCSFLPCTFKYVFSLLRLSPLENAMEKRLLADFSYINTKSESRLFHLDGQKSV